MLVLHALWQPDNNHPANSCLVFWAEVNPEYATKNHKLHPFALFAEQLEKYLITLCKKLAVPEDSLESFDLKLWLPSKGYTPQHSSLGFVKASTAKFKLRQWHVPARALNPKDSLKLLMALSEKDVLKYFFGNAQLGSDIYFWQKAAYLVLEALASHSFIPSTALEGNKLKVFWKLILDGVEQSRKVAELRDNLPPICLASCKDPEKPMLSQELLEHFLQTVADSVVRASLDEDIKSGIATRSGKLPKYQNQWIYALLDNKGYVDKPSKNLQNLAEKYPNWLRNLHVASNEHARVAFRLEEPSPRSKKKQWILKFLLQGKDDPSLFIPAKAVWKKELDTLGKLGQRFEGAHELLLTGLGYTARLFEPLKKALQSAAPEKATLNGEQAFDFLRNTAPLLEQSGFGVLVPSWWTRPSSQLGLKLRFSSPSDSGEGVASGVVQLKNLINYKWDVALGDSTLTPEEFETLVALKSPLVQVRGEWVRLDPEQVESAAEFFRKRQQQQEVGLLEAMQLSLTTDEEIAGLPVQKVEFEGQIANWMDKLSGKEKFKLLPQPKGLKGKLRPYQRKGYSWLEFLQSLGLGACLADDMGLGKTIQTLSLLSHQKAKKQLEGPVLLIAPTSVVTNWSKEAETFTPSLHILVHQGPERLKGKGFKDVLKKTDIVLSSYAIVRRDAELLEDISWQGVILDEAQNIKNPEAKQSKLIYSLKAGFRIALTGTPVENRLSELWSIMHFLNAGYLGSRQAFRKNMALPIEREQNQEALDSLRRLTSPFILRRLKTDKSIIKDLPEKTETKVYCKLTEEQASLYEVVVQDALKEIASADEGIARSGLVLSMLMKLKQICNHPAQFLHEGIAELENRSYKLNRLKDLLEVTLDVGDSSLIFTQFKEMGEMINHYLKQQFGVETLFLHGGTPAKKRAAMVERFQAEENSAPIFILSLKAGGTGLNLTKATHVFHFDRWWNPAVENQATDRAFRIGQKRNVQVHKFVCIGTLEERIDEMITKKQALADSVVSTGEKWVTELDTKSLRELVQLRKEELG